MKEILDKQFKEDATNFTGTTGIEIVYPDEYYQTYEDVFGDSAKDTMNVLKIYGMIMVNNMKDKVLEKTLILT